MSGLGALDFRVLKLGVLDCRPQMGCKMLGLTDRLGSGLRLAAGRGMTGSGFSD